MTAKVSEWRQLSEVVGALIRTIEPPAATTVKKEQGETAERR